MKNIKAIKRVISTLLLALILVSSLVLTGCSVDPHAGHDHSSESSVDLSILNAYYNVAKATVYPDVAAYKAEDVKKHVASKGFLLLLVVKVDEGQIYCANNNSKLGDYIIVDCPLDVKIGDYFVCDATTYYMSTEDYGFDANLAKIDTFYVVFGNEMNNPMTITKENAAKLIASIPSAPVVDEHAGHNH